MASNAFHGFHYLATEGKILKLAMSQAVQEYVASTIVPGLKDLPEKDYWKGYAKYMMSAVRQSYFAWEGRSYWCLELDPFTAIEFSPGKMRIAMVDEPVDEDAEEDPQYDIIYIPWDALMENDVEEWTKLSKKEMSILDSNIQWTQELHRRMEKWIPMARLLKG